MSNVVWADVDVLPGLPLEEWQDTYDTLHMWTQVVGKIPLMLNPRLNHWWEVALCRKVQPGSFLLGQL